MKKIFVQIPAYRDVELAPTLTDLFAKARRPDQLRVCVYWQHGAKETIPSSLLNHPCIEYIRTSYRKSQGCNWARRILQKKWKGEPYTLFLDSHHRFIQDWDQHLINMYRSLKKDGSKKPLITAYLPPYDPFNDPAGRDKDPLQIFGLSREKGMLIYLTSHPIPFWTWLEKPIPANFVSLHFIFTEGQFNKKIVFDDDIYFFGDEVVTGLRAFTHGYDLFHPHYVLGWHLYNRDNTRITHWTDHSDYEKRNDRSHEKLRNIFLGVEKKAFGKVKTLEEYEFLIGDKLITY